MIRRETSFSKDILDNVIVCFAEDRHCCQLGYRIALTHPLSNFIALVVKIYMFPDHLVTLQSMVHTLELLSHMYFFRPIAISFLQRRLNGCVYLKHALICSMLQNYSVSKFESTRKYIDGRTKQERRCRSVSRYTRTRGKEKRKTQLYDGRCINHDICTGW
jgi:hypothetical protein